MPRERVRGSVKRWCVLPSVFSSPALLRCTIPVFSEYDKKAQGDRTLSAGARVAYLLSSVGDVGDEYHAARKSHTAWHVSPTSPTLEYTVSAWLLKAAFMAHFEVCIIITRGGTDVSIYIFNTDVRTTPSNSADERGISPACATSHRC